MSIIKTYLRKNYTSKDGSSPIYISFYANRNKVVLPTKISCQIENFDASSGKITNKEKGYKDKNMIVDKILARINDIMVKFRLSDKTLTKDAFWKMYKRPDNFDTFFAFVRDYWKKHPYEIEFTTHKTHTDIINKLEFYKQDLHFDEISEDFITKYKIYLSKKLLNKESTIAKNMAVIKKYVRKAMNEGYIDVNPFLNIKIKRNVKGKFSYLSEEELNVLINKYNSKTLNKTYQDVLEFFLFLCFSSLHITDAKKLLIEQLGNKSFTYYRVKNRNSKPDPIIVPLSTPAKKILKKVLKKRTKGKVFEHIIADQKVNEYIKKIVKECEIKKDVSSKTGRHTFATFYLSKTKDITSLKEIMGHSDIRETLIYAHVLEETKLDAIKNFDIFTV